MKWGDWIRTRALIMDIPTKKEMAKRCSVTQKIVANWYAAALPIRIRETSINAIADTLDTHPDVIRSRYEEYDPASAPSQREYDGGQLFKLAPYQMWNLAKQAGFTELADELRDALRTYEIKSFLEILSGADLEAVRDFCRLLITKKMSEDIDVSQMREESERFNSTIQEQRRELMSQVEKRLRPK